MLVTEVDSLQSLPHYTLQLCYWYPIERREKGILIAESGRKHNLLTCYVIY